jgi:hypothetical protein
MNLKKLGNQPPNMLSYNASKKQMFYRFILTAKIYLNLSNQEGRKMNT